MNKSVKFVILMGVGIGLCVVNYFIGKAAGETLAEIMIERKELPAEEAEEE